MAVTGTGAAVRSLGGPIGFGALAVPRSDDGSLRIDARAVFETGLLWFGNRYAGDAIWINTNGTISFGAAFANYRPIGADVPGRDVIGAFWGDVDTRMDGEGAESGQVWVDVDPVADRLTVTWADVGAYRYDATASNLFQVQIFDRGGGDFDLTLRYSRIDWDIGSADDDGGAMAFLSGARIGQPVVLGTALTLDAVAGNAGLPGLWHWEFRGGATAGLRPATGLIRDGTAGPDTLDGGAGDDLLRGLSGNDVLRGADGADWLDGGDGSDTVNGGAGNDTLRGGLSEADLRDVIFGGDGADDIDAGHGNDQVYGGAGNDTIAGGFGADELIGQEGNDLITGGAFSDAIFGGDGDDFLNGGFGGDRLNGGAGADRFFHLGIFDHGSDWVQDYRSTDGDLLVWGGPVTARATEFQVNFTETANAGVSGVAEAFVIHRPTGQILWALVDGEAETAIRLRIGAVTYDL